MASIVINGNSFSGNSVVVVNGQVIVDGKNVTPESKTIKIHVEGYVADLRVDAGVVTVSGDVGAVNTMSGSLQVNGSIAG